MCGRIARQNIAEEALQVISILRCASSLRPFLRDTPFLRSGFFFLRYKSTEECKGHSELKPGARGAYPYQNDCQKRGGTPEKAMIPAPLRVKKRCIGTEQGDDVIGHNYVIIQAALYIAPRVMLRGFFTL